MGADLQLMEGEEMKDSSVGARGGEAGRLLRRDSRDRKRGHDFQVLQLIFHALYSRLQQASSSLPDFSSHPDRD